MSSLTIHEKYIMLTNPRQPQICWDNYYGDSKALIIRHARVYIVILHLTYFIWVRIALQEVD